MGVAKAETTWQLLEKIFKFHNRLFHYEQKFRNHHRFCHSNIATVWIRFIQREFANVKIRDINENRNMLHTAAKSPWQNGVHERNHRLRHCNQNQKVPGLNPTRQSARLRDTTSLRGSR